MYWSAHTMGLASYSALLCLHSFTSEFALSFARSALCSCYSCQDLMPPRIHYHYHSLRPKKNSRRPTLAFSKCAASQPLRAAPPAPSLIHVRRPSGALVVSRLCTRQSSANRGDATPCTLACSTRMLDSQIRFAGQTACLQAPAIHPSRQRRRCPKHHSLLAAVVCLRWWSAAEGG